MWFQHFAPLFIIGGAFYAMPFASKYVRIFMGEYESWYRDHADARKYNSTYWLTAFDIRLPGNWRSFPLFRFTHEKTVAAAKRIREAPMREAEAEKLEYYRQLRDVYFCQEAMKKQRPELWNDWESATPFEVSKSIVKKHRPIVQA
eukprot:TRINITY_DN309_c0_g1_i1.p1 TRINITY_DN309_c0_g1~~TRINITY_DN309_c0_g1_i1.p1  ORF type:complete len:146 (+),score=16.88 TRINITY_DN309_c0_g1_i1:138-575(+)